MAARSAAAPVPSAVPAAHAISTSVSAASAPPPSLGPAWIFAIAARKLLLPPPPCALAAAAGSTPRGTGGRAPDAALAGCVAPSWLGSRCEPPACDGSSSPVDSRGSKPCGSSGAPRYAPAVSHGAVTIVMPSLRASLTCGTDGSADGGGALECVHVCSLRSALFARQREHAVEAALQHGKQRLANSAWQTAHGRQRMANSAWQTAHGKQRLANSAWQTAHGRQRMANSAWQAAPGKQRMADSAWQTAHGKQRLANSAWQTAHGKQRMRDSAWQTAHGKQRMADSA
eukprot:364595-Chlamydomonas_euryale.AAC.21